MPKPQQLITIYGRNPVLEALQDEALTPLKLHLARNNRPAPVLEEIAAAAAARNVETRYHDRMALSRISKNRKQDQGVALDVAWETEHPLDALDLSTPRIRLLAADRIHNPQNLGMLIRSVGAGWLDGMLLAADAGNARISPLVIKASAGALFRTPLYRCQRLANAVTQLADHGFTTCCLAGDADTQLYDLKIPERALFIVGNETDGVDPQVAALADVRVRIPMQRGIDSLNVAVAGALIGYLPALRPH